MPPTSCATARFSSCSTPPKARRRLPTRSRCAEPPSCKKRPITPHFPGPSRPRKAFARSRRANSKSGHCKTIWRDGAKMRGRDDDSLTEQLMDKLPITAAGHAALEAEFLRRQQVERPRIIAAIAEARSHGDLSENAEYHSAKEAQSHNEGRIVELEDLLQRAEVIDVSKLNGHTIKFGATVTLIDEDTEEERVFQIVGQTEADVRAGKMSVTSPTGRALIGKKAGDTVEVNTPGGGKSYEIVKVAFI